MARHASDFLGRVNDTQRLQVALGKLRFVCGDFRGKVLIIDPHRVRSDSKRQMCLRFRLGGPVATWDATHFAKEVLYGLDGDVRVTRDTIVVTYYNAPNAELLRHHSEGLPDKLAKEGVSPKIPWLYGFNLDFRLR